MSNDFEHRINARHLAIAGGVISLVLGLCCYLAVANLNNVTKALDKLEQRVDKMDDKLDAKWEKFEEVTRLVVRHDGEIKAMAKDLERLERNQELNP
jgi:ActR/RegA family two-component response regulator